MTICYIGGARLLRKRQPEISETGYGVSIATLPRLAASFDVLLTFWAGVDAGRHDEVLLVGVVQRLVVVRPLTCAARSRPLNW